ncbi:hypothetical protein [Amycolatopsis lexingtonensis]|uniref:hypothetical protein n=1 Tax=Amycolatopsis lexingtonensis TaxID=218822 RepID=UPI003F706927
MTTGARCARHQPVSGGLDDGAVDQVYSGAYVGGSAVPTLNAVATAVGLPGIELEDLDGEDDFFV